MDTEIMDKNKFQDVIGGDQGRVIDTLEFGILPAKTTDPMDFKQLHKDRVRETLRRAADQSEDKLVDRLNSDQRRLFEEYKARRLVEDGFDDDGNPAVMGIYIGPESRYREAQSKENFEKSLSPEQKKLFDQYEKSRSMAKNWPFYLDDPQFKTPGRSDTGIDDAFKTKSRKMGEFTSGDLSHNFAEVATKTIEDIMKRIAEFGNILEGTSGDREVARSPNKSGPSNGPSGVG